MICLEQGWTEAQRIWWYTTTQGSRLVPLSWALALETEADNSPAFGDSHLNDLGYLRNPVSGINPYGLPVGFAVDTDASSGADIMCDTFPEMCRAGTMREPWIGLNCAACHTNEYEFGGKRLRVEGAPGLADFDRLINGTEAALRETLAQPDRFTRFSSSVLNGRRDLDTLQSLRRQMEEQIAWFEKLRLTNGDRVHAGPARLDAQGHILTKVSYINGTTPSPGEIQSDAPVSYPHIWNTHQQDILQWNGIAPRLLKIELIPGRPVELGALIRNTSEVIGVFGQIDASRGKAWSGYENSIRVGHLISMERQLATLNSPAWPAEIFGDIDPALAEIGKGLFETHCQECHAPLARGDLVTEISVHMEPLRTAGTDIFLACNTYLRQGDAGNMAGQSTLGWVGEEIEEVDFIHKMLVNAATGAIIENRYDVLKSIFADSRSRSRGVREAGGPVGDIEYLPDVRDPQKKAQAEICLNEKHPLLRYKARPLNGIWATAPYLHNGSVPTLYDLLLPAKARNIKTATTPVASEPTRPESFGVGGRIFDTVKVGFSTAETDNPWMFRVRDDEGFIIPGNSNAGHDEYGEAGFTHDQRMAIVEYLKSL